MKTKLKLICTAIVILFLINTNSFSQNIDNKLGVNGLFTVKDNANTFLSLSQTTGDLTLSRNITIPYSSSGTLGVIFKEADRFIHNYRPANTDGANTFIGIKSGNFTMNGGEDFEANNNTGVGFSTLKSLTTGYSNSAFGSNSLLSNETGFGNSAFGVGSLSSNTTGLQNCAFGSLALQWSNGSENSAFGRASLTKNSSGNQNCAFGTQALQENTSGSENCAFGYIALYAATEGTKNSVFGNKAGTNVTSGSNLTCIGYDAEPTSGTATNEITLGNNQITSLRCNVQNITALSDARDKKNVKELSLGLEFLMKLKPRQFNWDKREWYDNNISDGSKMNEAPSAGFIAQELDDVQMTEGADWLNLVLKNNPEKIEATYGNLLPVMVKAIQDLKTENDNLKNANEELMSEVESLKNANERITKLEKIVNEMSSYKQASFDEVVENKSLSNSK